MTPYDQILRQLVETDVEFILGGGVACVLHGVERVTMDVDMAVHMTPDNWQRFLGAMAKLGLRMRVPVSPAALLDTRFVETLVREKHALVFTFVDADRPYRQVDLFLTPELSYQSLLPDSELMDLGGIDIRVINRRRLLEIKRAIDPPRMKDRLDIEHLSRDSEPS